MQMIPGLDRSPQSKGSSKGHSAQAEASKVGRPQQETAQASWALERLSETYDKLNFEKDFMVDWYERKTNRRLEPDQIVRNVLGGQAHREYVETLNRIGEIANKLNAIGDADKK